MVEICKELKYSIWVTKKSTLGWHKKFLKLSAWCKDNCNYPYVIASPSPTERVFIFDDESDALAFKLYWS